MHRSLRYITHLLVYHALRKLFPGQLPVPTRSYAASRVTPLPSEHNAYTQSLFVGVTVGRWSRICLPGALHARLALSASVPGRGNPHHGFNDTYNPSL